MFTSKGQKLGKLLKHHLVWGGDTLVALYKREGLFVIE